MPIELIDKIKQKNNGTFPLVEAQDVEVSKDVRLPKVLEDLSTKEQTITNPTNEPISLSTKITNIIFNTNYTGNTDDVSLIFSYGGQNECVIIIYNNTENSITLPTNYSKIGDYEVVSLNGTSSVTLQANSSCEISMLFTNNECRMLILEL